MSYYVLPSRIRLHQEDHGCDIKTELKGGLKENSYMLLHEDNTLTNKVYVATKPSKAAIKAYYSQIRDMDSSKFELLEKSQITFSQDEKYLKALQDTRMPPKLLIKLMCGKKIYSYSVEYVCNTNPNAHELKHCITKVAKATKI